MIEEMENILEIVKKYRSLCAEEKIGIKINAFKPSENPRDIVAIDGSYSFIFNNASLWIAIVRATALHYEYNGAYRLKKNYLIERPVLISSNEEFVKNLPELHQEVFRSAKNSQLKIHLYSADEFRRLCEHELLGAVAKEVSNAIIAMDGTLTTPFLKEFKEKMMQTLKICEENKNILIGVSKDSQTHAFGSYLTDEELLSKTEENFFYAKVPDEFKNKYKPPLYGDVYFARLFQKAKCFRIDTAAENPGEVFSELSCYAKSELCPGYVYPLLEAHRYAVVVRQLRSFYEDVLLKLAHASGIAVEEILRGRTNIDGRNLLAFHEFLDEVVRG